MTRQELDTAVWDCDKNRGTDLKTRLDMLARGDHETPLYGADWAGKPCHDVNVLSFGECGEPVLTVARSVRQAREAAFMILVTERGNDISACFRPRIRPSGVLFRPVTGAHLTEMLDEIASELERLVQEENEDVFLLKSEGVLYRIPFREILFFEASNKKVTLHTDGQEIGYYESIDNLAAVLPRHFIRAHRSYLINVRKIMEIKGSEVLLSGGCRVPLSRSCREAVIQAVKGK